jgi:peroxiredoxin
MGTAILMAGCLMLPAQGSAATEANLTLRLTRGQELIYRGTYCEEILSSAMPSKQNLHLDVKVFVLSTSAETTNLAILTQLRSAKLPKKGFEEAAPKSLRLDLVRLNSQGKAEASQGEASLPLKGPPGLEWGMFIETGRNPNHVGISWKSTEANRPPITWKLVGSDNIGSLNCWKVVGVQQTEDWEKPRADRSAWKRTDTLWLVPRLGVAQRVERVIEHREPARQASTEKYSVRYDLESCLQYPGELSKDRQREINLVQQISQALRTIQDQPARSVRQLDVLQARIANHLENQPPTPYRDAVLQVKRRVEAAQRGETTSEGAFVKSDKPPAIAESGQRAPDFVTMDFGARRSVALKDCLGKRILMIFYNPGSRTAIELLNFAQEAQAAHREDLTILGLSMTEDAEVVLKQQADLRLTFPLMHGAGLRQSYSVDTTPKLMLLDAKGIVRGTYVGWGSETGAAILADLKSQIANSKSQIPNPKQVPNYKSQILNQ